MDNLGRSVTGLNVWLEHSHRLLAGLLGILILILGIWVLRSYRGNARLLWSTVAAGVMVLIQALLGAFVVWNLVRAELVTTHLALGTATMGMLIYIAWVGGGGSAPTRRDTPAAKARRFTLWTAGAAWLQTLIGGHLSGIHGGLAFKSDPLLGLFSVGPINVEADAVNVIHRFLAFGVAALIMMAMAKLRRADVSGMPLHFARLAGGLVVLQILLGVGNLYSDLSFLSVVPHLAVASWMIAALLIAGLWATDEERPGVSRRDSGRVAEPTLV